MAVDIDYLDKVTKLGVIQAYKHQSFALMQIKEGDSILDLGCGTGHDALIMSGMTGSKGRVIGLDNRPNMIAEAWGRARNEDPEPSYLVGDGYNLVFHDGTFDSCRTDRVLHSLEDPRRVLTEMIRVTRSGGHIVACEPDWETIMIDSPIKSLTRKILNCLCDSLPGGWVGRQLPRLFNELGMKNVTTILTTGRLETFAQANELLHLEQAVTAAIGAGLINWVEGLGWLQHLQRADQEGKFFCGMTGLTVYGQTP